MTRTVTTLRGLPHETVGDPAKSTRAGSDFSDFLLAVRRQAWVVALCTLAGLVAGSVHYATSPKEYFASATVLLDERQSDLAQEISSALPMTRDDTGVLNELQILRSLELARVVVEDLSLHENDDFLFPEPSLAGRLRDRLKSALQSFTAPQPPDPTQVDASGEGAGARIENAAIALRSRTEFTRLGRSYAIEISYISHDPALAAEIANSYAAAYMTDGVRANRQASDRTADWMLGRMEELRVAAAEAAEEAEDFRAETGAMDQQGLREREQKAEALNELFMTLRERYERIVMEGSYPVSKGRILSQATVPKLPALPKLWQVLAVGFALGAMAGLAIAVVRESRETGFRTGGDVREATGRRFLGYVPRLRRSRLRLGSESAFLESLASAGRFVSSRLVVAGDGTQRLAVPEDEAPAVPPKPPGRVRTRPVPVASPGSPEDLAFRNLLANEDANPDRKDGRVLGVTGILPGEGATTAALNLAAAAAREGTRTLLVDLDRPLAGLTAHLGLSGSGLAEVLSGAIPVRQAIRGLSETGPDFLPAGDLGAGELPSLRRIHAAGDMLLGLRSAYDLVVLDLPPAGTDAETKAAPALVDGFVLVARWGRTPRRILRAFLEQEPELAGKVVGTVLNRTTLGRLPHYGVALGRTDPVASGAPV